MSGIWDARPVAALMILGASISWALGIVPPPQMEAAASADRRFGLDDPDGMGAHRHPRSVLRAGASARRFGGRLVRARL
jgi:hypothetical protein